MRFAYLYSCLCDQLRAGRSEDRIPMGARFSAPVQAGPGAHPASCTMGTVSFPGVKSCRGVTLTPHLLLLPWSRKSRSIPVLPLWAVRTVQSLSACTRVTFTFTFILALGKNARTPEYKHTLVIFNTHCISTARMVMGTRLNIALQYTACLLRCVIPFVCLNYKVR